MFVRIPLPVHLLWPLRYDCPPLLSFWSSLAWLWLGVLVRMHCIWAIKSIAGPLFLLALYCPRSLILPRHHGGDQYCSYLISFPKLDISNMVLPDLASCHLCDALLMPRTILCSSTKASVWLWSALQQSVLLMRKKICIISSPGKISWDKGQRSLSQRQRS